MVRCVLIVNTVFPGLSGIGWVGVEVMFFSVFQLNQLSLADYGFCDSLIHTLVML
jgi:hypothetical protein